MVRSTIRPGPLEGQRVVDKDEKPVGVVEDVNVLGGFIASFTVKLDKGGRAEVPRDWFVETVAEGIQVAGTVEEVRALARRH